LATLANVDKKYFSNLEICIGWAATLAIFVGRWGNSFTETSGHPALQLRM
jgi:hypothetical protein